MRFVNKPQLEYQLHERKNGSKFIKILLYINDADGYVEVARVNQSKSHWNDNGYGELDEIYDELNHNSIVTEFIAKTQPGMFNS